VGRNHSIDLKFFVFTLMLLITIKLILTQFATCGPKSQLWSHIGLDKIQEIGLHRQRTPRNEASFSNDTSTDL